MLLANFFIIFIASLQHLLVAADTCNSDDGCRITVLTGTSTSTRETSSEDISTVQSCLVYFAAAFTLYDPSKSQHTALLPGTDIGCSLSKSEEWQALTTAALSTGRLIFSQATICVPTLSPSTAASLMTTTKGADSIPTPVTAFTWSWWCTTDACATVTSTKGETNLVVSYGSGSGDHSHGRLTATPTAADEHGLSFTGSDSCFMSSTTVVKKYIVTDTVTYTYESTYSVTKTTTTTTTTTTPPPKPPPAPSTTCFLTVPVWGDFLGRVPTTTCTTVSARGRR